MEHTLIVAGIGPGSKDYILPKALESIEKARFLVGGRRALADYAREGQEIFPITGKLSLLAEWLEQSLLQDDVVVQASFALLREPWQEAKWLSFHGRKPRDEDLVYEKGRKLAFLTDHDQNPSYIANYLIKQGWPEDTRAAACEHISYENQQVRESTLKDLTLLEGFGESVMVVIG